MVHGARSYPARPKAKPTEVTQTLVQGCGVCVHCLHIITWAGLIAWYFPLFAVISKACGTDSMPSRTCVIVGLSRTRPEATSRTVCSRWPAC